LFINANAGDNYHEGVIVSAILVTIISFIVVVVFLVEYVLYLGKEIENISKK